MSDAESIALGSPYLATPSSHTRVWADRFVFSFKTHTLSPTGKQQCHPELAKDLPN